MLTMMSCPGKRQDRTIINTGRADIVNGLRIQENSFYPVFDIVVIQTDCIGKHRLDGPIPTEGPSLGAILRGEHRRADVQKEGQIPPVFHRVAAELQRHGDLVQIFGAARDVDQDCGLLRRRGANDEVLVIKRKLQKNCKENLQVLLEKK